MITAKILIVGNEILSGRTKDVNSYFLATQLRSRGIMVSGIEVLPDDVILLSQWISHNRNLYDYLFISGGIGGTPDDVTREAVARAFGKRLVRNPGAEKILRDYYKERVNESRLRMADLPEGCELIENPISKAPGLKIENIFVFAGIPSVLNAMFDAIKNLLVSEEYFEITQKLKVGEGDVAIFLKDLQAEFHELSIGSYPTLDRSQEYKTEIVLGSFNKSLLDRASKKFLEMCKPLGSIFVS